jgi:hypothetical protein
MRRPDVTTPPVDLVPMPDPHEAASSQPFDVGFDLLFSDTLPLPFEIDANLATAFWAGGGESFGAMLW